MVLLDYPWISWSGQNETFELYLPSKYSVFAPSIVFPSFIFLSEKSTVDKKGENKPEVQKNMCKAIEGNNWLCKTRGYESF